MDATTTLGYAPAIGAEIRFTSTTDVWDHLQMKVEHLCSLLNVLSAADLKEWTDDTLASLMWLLTTLITEIKASLSIACPSV